MNTLSCVAMKLWLPGPGLPHCEELFPSLPSPCPGTPELCSSLLLWHAAVSLPSGESSPKWTTVAISKQFFFFLIQCLGVQIMFVIVAKIMEWKVGLLPKKRRKIYLTKLKWFRPSLRFLKLGLLRFSALLACLRWGAARETQQAWHGTQRWPLEAWRITVTVEFFWHLLCVLEIGSSLGFSLPA